MVIDGWTSAGGRPEALKYLGVFHIVNPAGLASVQAELTRQTAQPGQQVMTVPSDLTWNQNPFARSGSRVARALSLMIPATVRVKGHLKRASNYEDPREGTNLVLEFGEFQEVARPSIPESGVPGLGRDDDGPPVTSLNPIIAPTIDPQTAQELADEQGFDLLSVNVTLRGQNPQISPRSSSKRNRIVKR